MQGISGISSLATDARPVVRVAWRGLVEVLLGTDPSPTGWWRSPWRRGVAYLALGGTTLLLCAASLASLAAGPGKARACPDAKVYAPHTVRCPVDHSLPGMFGGPMTLWVLVAVGVVVVPLALGPVSAAGLAGRVARAVAGPAA